MHRAHIFLLLLSTVTAPAFVSQSTVQREQGSSDKEAPVEILSDTQGVDFGPYATKIATLVNLNWHQLIPDGARPPRSKQGKVVVEFVILKDGKLGGMKIANSSGDVALDRAALGGIASSAPFKPLPPKFTGNQLTLRFSFYYNQRPKKSS